MENTLFWQGPPIETSLKRSSILPQKLIPIFIGHRQVHCYIGNAFLNIGILSFGLCLPYRNSSHPASYSPAYLFTHIPHKKSSLSA